jgi:hypothetical protein
MVRTVLGLSALVIFVGSPAHGAGQVSIEGRAGASWPIGELADDPGLDQSLGVGIALDVMYAAMPNVSLYAGGSRHSFNCDDCSADVTTSGFDAGVKYLFPGGGPTTAWIRGGALLHRASIDGENQDWGVGVDTGAGLDIAVRRSLSFVPAVRLSSYGSGALSLTYVTLDLGVHFLPALE